MNALLLTLFVSGIILILALVFFWKLSTSQTFEEHESTAFMPLWDGSMVDGASADDNRTGAEPDHTTNLTNSNLSKSELI